MLASYWRAIAAMLAVQAASAVLVSLQPRYFQRIVSLTVGGGGSNLLREGMPLAATLAGIYAAGTLLNGFGGYIACVFSPDLLGRLQTDFFKKMSGLPLQFFRGQSSGELVTKFNNDLGRTQGFISSFIPSALHETVTAVAVTVFLFWSCSFRLTLIALSIVLVTSVLVIRLNRLLAPYADEQRVGWSDINRIFDETVHGIDTLKLFATEKERTEMFERQTAEFRSVSVKAGTIAALFSPGIDLISKLGSLLLILAAYFMISKGEIGVDNFLLFFFYAGLLQASVSSLIGLIANIQPQLVAVRNLSSFFYQPPEDAAPSAASARIEGAMPIEISGLTFSYPGGRMLFRNAGLMIPARAITVIHGPSGSGKSTLINILSRFHTPLSGSIKIGGVHIEEYDRTHLRQNISVMTQNHFLFNESLEMNLHVAKPDASTDEILHALERARLGEFVRRLPGGIKGVMDPRGTGVSGGEKQRICLARILLKNSAIMVLDEPWASIGREDRELLTQVINDCKKTSTIIILLHETPLSLEADMVYDLLPDEGKFVLNNSQGVPDLDPGLKTT